MAAVERETAARAIQARVVAAVFGIAIVGDAIEADPAFDAGTNLLQRCRRLLPGHADLFDLVREPSKALFAAATGPDWTEQLD